MTTPPLHPALEPLADLVGSFEGDGVGDYPTIERFDYRERITFEHVGKPVLAYEQRTWDPGAGTPMHGERGYLRPAGDGHVELTVAHVFGITELQEGTLETGQDGRSLLRLGSTCLGVATTAKAVGRVSRVLRFDADRVDYDLWMAYADVPETHHLAATLWRVS